MDGRRASVSNMEGYTWDEQHTWSISGIEMNDFI